MKVYFNRPIKKEAWGGGSHFITNLFQFLKEKNVDVTFTLDSNIDVMLMFDPRRDGYFLGINELKEFKSKTNTPIIQRINDTDIARHAYGLTPHDKPWRIKTFLYANQFVDHTVFISKWVKNHYKAYGYKKRDREDSIIINGCNTEYFYPKIGNLNSKKLKLITHHWSDNPMKGLDVYIALDEICQKRKDIEFTYLGRYPKGFVPKATTVIPPTYGKQIGNILRAHHVYITGARFEACGMHHIEAAACGLPIIYHKDGGAIPEVCSNYGRELVSHNDLFECIDYYSSESNRINDIKKIDYDLLSNDRCCNEYFNAILKTVEYKKLRGEQ